MSFARRSWTDLGLWSLGVAVGAITAITVVWVVTVERTQHEYTQTIRDAGKQNSNLAIALEEHAVRSLTTVDEALTLMSKSYLRDGPHLDADGLFEVGTASNGMVVNFGVMDEQDRLVWSGVPSSAVKPGDRRFFLEHRDRPTVDMRIPAPTLSRQSNDWTIVMSKRISRSDGSFGGVAFVAVNPHYFTRFYGQADLGREGRISLIGLDGILRARRAGETEVFAEEVRATNPVLAAVGLSLVLRARSLVGPGVPRAPRFAAPAPPESAHLRFRLRG